MKTCRVTEGVNGQTFSCFNPQHIFLKLYKITK
ncbi:hypothetical protein E2C01_057757 [Portunus trituberculatus]|uniref:Uncharacterized protein n=1 Tax=Portunus trituberculatus TaxID=210409 RepID=A0A5B7H1C6_PORTR|nr:hypothetical protein [Portunus trituberculatus]